MTPQDALDLQISKYRLMTGEQRLGLALELHELSCKLARQNIRQQNPDADSDEVDRLLRKRIEIARD